MDSRNLAPLRGWDFDTIPSTGLRPWLHSYAAPRLERANCNSFTPSSDRRYSASFRTLLENIFQRKLHDPWTCVTAGNLAELTATECRIGITKPETVRDIECLRPEFHLLAFGHLEFSRNCLRPVPESRGPQTADTHIPVGADWRERKRVRIEPTNTRSG